MRGTYLLPLRVVKICSIVELDHLHMRRSISLPSPTKELPPLLAPIHRLFDLDTIRGHALLDIRIGGRTRELLGALAATVGAHTVAGELVGDAQLFETIQGLGAGALVEGLLLAQARVQFALERGPCALVGTGCSPARRRSWPRCCWYCFRYRGGVEPPCVSLGFELLRLAIWLLLPLRLEPVDSESMRESGLSKGVMIGRQALTMPRQTSTVDQMPGVDGGVCEAVSGRLGCVGDQGGRRMAYMWDRR